jgi:hypothetical protein
MKANRRFPAPLVLAAATAALLLASCSERRVIPAPTPTPSARPLPPPPPLPPAANWRDAPITPGDWSWSSQGGQSVARFAGGALVLRCDRAAGTVTLLREGTGAGQVAMTILTTGTTRSLTATALPGPPAAIAVTLPARDSLLDAMAFSRGRFAVQTAGLPPLYVPSWPEVARVIEDCR